MKFTFTKLALCIAIPLLIISFIQEQRQNQEKAKQKIDLIPIFTAETYVWVQPHENWQSKVYGDAPNGLIAVYNNDITSVVIMQRDAGNWTVQHSVDVHQEELKADANTLLCGDCCELTDQPTKTLRFAYIANGSAVSVKDREEFTVPILHVVETRIIGHTIFRVQASIFGHGLDSSSIEKNSVEFKKALQALERVWFTEIEMSPQEEAEKPEPIPAGDYASAGRLRAFF